MRLLPLLLSLCILGEFSAQAKALKKKQVPVAVRGAFKKQFPHTKAKWQMEAKQFEAHFTKNNHMQHAAYDSTGLWAYTETVIKKEQLPEAVTKAIAQAEYNKWGIAEADKVTTASYSEAYRMIYRKGDTQISLLLLPNGNAIKKVEGKIGE